jgi:two-component system phosphate regulon sensor histidine kinase PhoR
VVTPEFREKERLYAKARHDEAQALFNARQEERKLADAEWQGVVADKDAALAGTGLGLSIVKHGVMLHGAKVDMRSDGETGTAVTVSFPASG